MRHLLLASSSFLFGQAGFVLGFVAAILAVEAKRIRERDLEAAWNGAP